jgi:hypothetical protein
MVSNDIIYTFTLINLQTFFSKDEKGIIQTQRYKLVFILTLM